MRLIDYLDGNDFYQYIGIRAQEVAALIGISPQTLSSYSIDDLTKDNKLERLYKALFYIGTDRYILAAKKVAFLADKAGIKIDYSSAETRIEPYRIYNNKEVWFFSDNPTSIIDENAFFDSIFSKERKQQYIGNIFSFFFRTIDGATRFAEIIERKAISPIFSEGNNLNKSGLIYNNYIYLIVTNIFPFGEDFIIINPGSLCARAPGTPTSVFYDGNSYVMSTNSQSKIIDEVRSLDIGTRYQPENFFPLGVKLTRDIFCNDSVFTDPLIGVRSESISGGILEKGSQMIFSSCTDEEKDKNRLFSEKAGFTPVAILALKKYPGSSFSTHKNKILNLILEESSKKNVFDEKNTSSFW